MVQPGRNQAAQCLFSCPAYATKHKRATLTKYFKYDSVVLLKEQTNMTDTDQLVQIVQTGTRAYELMDHRLGQLVSG